MQKISAVEHWSVYGSEGLGTMQGMRTAFGAELIGELAAMGRLAGQIMINASAALLQADLALAELVIARGDEMDARHHEVQQRCITMLRLQAPAATDLPTVVMALHTVRDLRRMGSLAQHTAKIVPLTYPALTVPDDVRTVIAQMSLLASGLAHQAATALEKLDPLFADRLARVGDEVDALRRHLLRILFAENWSYGVGPALHAALAGRYCEHFADHAVAIARQVYYLTTGWMLEPLPPAGEPLDEWLALEAGM